MTCAVGLIKLDFIYSTLKFGSYDSSYKSEMFLEEVSSTWLILNSIITMPAQGITT